MRRLKVLILIFCGIVSSAARGQDRYLPYNPEESKTYISTLYFGPNAFQVPDMLKNTSDKLEVELSGNGYRGFLTSSADKTASLDFKARVPLWTGRVNLSVWGQAQEWYWDTPEVREIRRVTPDKPLTGHQLGDLYFSVDIRVLEEKRYAPCITLRAACKTASGANYTSARYYDCPGYFFDACFSKNIAIGKSASLNVAASSGFLCWQVDNGRQNDAFMYGISLGLESPYINLAVDYGGYLGWKAEGDTPMTLKVRADIIPQKMFHPYFQYQRGLKDWPFDQWKAGVVCRINILPGQRSTTL